jgi:ketosteroid isomerase-like protein
MPEQFQQGDLVERTRKLIAIANRAENLDAVLASYAPDAVLELRDVSTPAGMATISKGVEAFGATLTEWWSVWEGHHHHIEEIVDMGNGVVYTVAREDSRLRGSQARVEQTNAHVLHWVDGSIDSWMIYRDVDRGRADAERLAREPS